MKLTRFHKIILFLTGLLICLLSYQYVQKNNMNEFVVLLAVGLPFAVVMGITFIATKPDNLGNSEYRYSKKGREEWDERNEEFTDSKTDEK